MLAVKDAFGPAARRLRRPWLRASIDRV